MKNLGNISDTFLIIDRYSDYMYRRAWGKVMIIWGILLPLTITIFTLNTQLSILLDVEEIFLKFLATGLCVLFGTSFTLYIFLSVPKLTLRTKEEDEPSSIIGHYHGILLGLTWFILFQIPNFIIAPFHIVSYVVVSSIALIFSYLLLEKIHGRYKELLISGTVLLMSSIPLTLMVFLDLIVLAQISTAIVFAYSFLSGGFYSMYMAGKILDGNF